MNIETAISWSYYSRCCDTNDRKANSSELDDSHKTKVIIKQPLKMIKLKARRL